MDRIKHLTTLEEVLKTSLDIFNFIVSNKNSSDLDNIMEQESLMIIDEFQRLVLKTKNDQNSIKETKKTIEKTQQQQNSEDATTKSPETANSHHFQTPANSTGSVSDASTQQQQDNSQPKNAVDAIVGGVMKNVANEADKLETDMKHDSFAESQKAKGTTVETVLKVDGSASSSAKDGGEHSNAPDGSSESGPKQDMTKEAHAPLLIDSENNQYVLSKSGDGTAHVEDVRLLSDILLLLIVCALGMLVFHALGMPSFFAYILAGVVLGQQGLIKSDVQVETISRGLGVLFIMFFLGLEFNPDKIRKVWNVSIFGSILMLGAMLLVVTGLGVYVLNAKYAECFIVGSCLFLSSTAVILHVFKPGESETVYGRSILGILITQDVLLGLLLVMMPALKSSGLEGLKTLLRNLALLIVFLVECAILRKPFIQILQWLQRSKSSDEIFLLSCIGICLFVIEVGKYLEQSLELSCFVAGVAISSRQSVADTAIRVIEPLRGLFAALFFASIGLHIFPTFFIHEGLLLVSLTLCVVLLKMVVVFGVFRAIFTYTSRSSLTIAVGLGQISEFTFVLASKAKR